MPVKELVVSQFLVSFSQNGVFLSDSVMNRLKLQPGDAVEIRLLCGGEMASTCWSFVKSKLDWQMDRSINPSFWDKGPNCEGRARKLVDNLYRASAIDYYPS